MSKKTKISVIILLIILLIIIIIGAVFFKVDYDKVQKQEKPKFCIKHAAYLDGGTVEYLGLGYKIIYFHTISGFNDIKIGSWFMDINDFKEEIDEYEKKYNKTISESTFPIIKYTGIVFNNLPEEYKLSNDEAIFILDLVSNMKCRNFTCDGLAEYELKIGESNYGIEIYSDQLHIVPYNDNIENEAVITGEDFIKLKQILDKIHKINEE